MTSFSTRRPASIMLSTAESTAARFIFMKSVSVLSTSKMTALITRSPRLFLDPLHVLTGAGVHPDPIALFDEERHVDLQSRLQGRRLDHVGDRVALHARHRRGDGEHHVRRQL